MTFAYQPVWKCIYCGSDTLPLSREHIVPSGLGGDRILPRASCEECREITRKIELHCLRTILGNPRITLGVHTDHPHERPDHLSILYKDDDGSERRILVQAAKFPTMVALPIFPPARLLRGLPYDDGPVNARMWTYKPQDNKLSGFLLEHGGNSIVVGQGDPHVFVRMLAKIAHSFAAAELGVDAFDHWTTMLIKGQDKSLNYLVGCLDDPDLRPENKLHDLNQYTHNEHGIIVVTIRLFANMGAPTYHVVVGIKKGPRGT